jgi:hypothetical protein
VYYRYTTCFSIGTLFLLPISLITSGLYQFYALSTFKETEIMLHHFSILFFVYKSGVNNKGCLPIFCRVTLNGVRKQFSKCNDIKDRNWSSISQRFKGSSEEAKLINASLDAIEKKLNKYYHDVLNEKEEMSVEDLYNRFAGNDQKFRTIMQVFDYHNEK